MSDPISRDIVALLASDHDVTQLKLAQSIGRHQSMVSLYARGSSRGGHDLPAVLVPAVCQALDDYRLMQTLARLCGGRFVLDSTVTATATETPRSEVERSVEHVCGAAEYQGCALSAEADGRITESESRRLLELAQRQLELWETARQRHANALRKFEVGRAVNNAIRRVAT